MTSLARLPSSLLQPGSQGKFFLAMEGYVCSEQTIEACLLPGGNTAGQSAQVIGGAPKRKCDQMSGNDCVISFVCPVSSGLDGSGGFCQTSGCPPCLSEWGSISVIIFWMYDVKRQFC